MIERDIVFLLDFINYLVFLELLRRETINLLEYLFTFLVFLPPVTFPQISFGRLVPRGCLPLPPP